MQNRREFARIMNQLDKRGYENVWDSAPRKCIRIHFLLYPA